MIIINTPKKRVVRTVIFITVVSLALNIFTYSQNKELSKRYTSLLCMTTRCNNLHLITFVTSQNVSAQQSSIVEIFHIRSGKVIKTIPNNLYIQNEVINILGGITDPYEKVKGFPEEGIIIKIPFQPPLTIESKWLNHFSIKSLDQVFILFPRQEKPYLLVLDGSNRPIFYNFEGSTADLLKSLNYPL